MPLFARCCQWLCTSCEWLTVVLGKSVAWLTCVMALLTTAIILARAIWGAGTIAAQESLTYMHAMVIMLASAYTWQSNGHVRVDIFYRRFAPVQKAWVNLLGTVLFLLPFALFSVLISWQYVASSWAIRETSADAGGLPAVFLLKSLILANGSLLILQGLADIARQLLTLTYQPANHA